MTSAAAIIILTLGAISAKSAPTDYQRLEIEGFTVLVNQQLGRSDPNLARQTIEELSHQLYQIRRVVPAVAFGLLQAAPIWVELDNGPAAMWQHVSRDWLAENGHNPDKAGSVEIRNARLFLEWTKDQPWMVLHELAHFYHNNILGQNNSRIKKAYEDAAKSGKYEKVLHINGKTVRAYALTNEQEYFAETAEAFFGTNDMYPFVRAELKTHDPNMYELHKQLWNKPPERPFGKIIPAYPNSIVRQKR